MQILVCGGRDYRDTKLICDILDSYLNDYPQSLSIVEGGAPGADHIAFQYRVGNGRNPARHLSRQQWRSLTASGIADAMASQWGPLL